MDANEKDKEAGYNTSLSELLGYVCLGGLIGLLLGFSRSSDISNSIIAGVLAFSGGLTLYLNAKISKHERQYISAALAAVSTFIIAGFIAGFFLNELYRTYSYDQSNGKFLDTQYDIALSNAVENSNDESDSDQLITLIEKIEDQREKIRGDSILRSSSISSIQATLEQYRQGIITAEDALALISENANTVELDGAGDLGE